MNVRRLPRIKLATNVAIPVTSLETVLVPQPKTLAVLGVPTLRVVVVVVAHKSATSAPNLDMLLVIAPSLADMIINEVMEAVRLVIHAVVMVIYLAIVLKVKSVTIVASSVTFLGIVLQKSPPSELATSVSSLVTSRLNVLINLILNPVTHMLNMD